MPRKIPAYKKVLLEKLSAPPKPDPKPEETQIAPKPVPAVSLMDKPMSPKILTTMEIRSRIIALMNERNYDPIRELIKLANNSDTPLNTRIDIHRELSQYIAPKLKSTDLQVSGEMSLTVNVVKFGNGELAANREAIPVRAVAVQENG